MKRTNRLKIKITENDVKRQVKDYLNIKGWFNFPLTAGMGSYPGLPDRIAIKNGRTLYIEVKRPGGKQSVNQMTFQSDIWAKGGHYILVKCLDDMIQAIDKLEGRL